MSAVTKQTQTKLLSNDTWSFWAEVFLSHTSITIKLFRIRSNRDRVTRTGATCEKNHNRNWLTTSVLFSINNDYTNHQILLLVTQVTYGIHSTVS